jgi:hypothetical protein
MERATRSVSSTRTKSSGTKPTSLLSESLLLNSGEKRTRRSSTCSSNSNVGGVSVVDIANGSKEDIGTNNVAPHTMEESEEIVRTLNSTWHGDEDVDWRRSSLSVGSDPTQYYGGARSPRSRSFDDRQYFLEEVEEAAAVMDRSHEGISMAVYDALSEMQSPLMNSFVRRGNR